MGSDRSGGTGTNGPEDAIASSNVPVEFRCIYTE